MAALALAMLAAVPSPAAEAGPPAAVGPVPHQRQIDWQEQEFIAFIHFGINTFNNAEWSDGRLPASSFNPTELDTDQWMSAYKAAGMRMVIITAKHHDGFTLWPSTTAPNYSVAATPWKGGKGDLVADIAASARKYGLDFGIYISPWDRYQEEVLEKTSNEYNDIFNTQLTEVLSNYGAVEEIWFDGATESRYTMDWERFYATIRTLQPNTVIAIAGPDVGHIGNENGDGKDPLWSPTELTNRNHRTQTAFRNFNPSGASVDSSFLGRSGTRTLYWRPEEVDVSIRGGWFWHAHENNRLKSLRRLQEIYYGSVGSNSLFLLNVPPDTRGLVHENDVKRLKEFGDLIKATFATDYTDTATATASNVRGAGVVTTYAASNLIDDDKTTYWTTDDSITSPSFTVTFNAAKSVGLVELQEYIQLGQRVQTFKVEAMVGGSWTQVASGNTIGYKRILELANPATTDKVRVTFTSSRDIPVIHSFGVYAPQVVPVSNDTRSNNVAYLSHATQSSAGTPASLAVDGVTDGTYSHRSVTHTARASKQWWQTDLGASFDIREIMLWNRTDCCGSRLRDFHVFISDSPFASDDPDVTSTATGVWHHRNTGIVGETSVISVPNVSGRYVRVQLRDNEPLSLAEVEVIGSAQNLVGSGTSTASGSLTGQGPAEAFDGSYATNWRAGAGTAWISYRFGSTGRPNVTGYAVTATASGLNSPTGWTFEGSNDGGTTWTSLDTQTGQTFIGGQRSTYSIESDQTFNIYRLSMTNSAGNTIDVAEIEFYAGPIPSLAANTLTATLSPLTLTVSEAGSATYTMKLDAAPTANVTVTPSSSDVLVATVSPARLTFTTANYGTPQAVTVTGIDDDVDNATDREATISHAVAGGGYDGVSVASVAVTATDDASPGVTVSGTALTVAEAGGRATYTVKLDAEPTGSVTVTPTSGNATVAIVSPGQLTFTTDNYATPQTVTVTGVDDAVDNASDRRATTVTHAVAGGGYDDVSVAVVTVTATDDDSAGVTVSETALTVAEAGGTATYTVRLNTKPTGDVTVTPTSGDESVATASGALTFTTTNYATPQTVTVTGVDDDLDDAADREATISHAVAGGGYDGVSVASVTVTATDDDSAGVTVSETTLTLAEAGGTATYTVKLDAKPTGSVTVTPTSGTPTVATTSGALTFTTTNFGTPQTVTVTGVDDDLDNAADREATISHAVAGGGYDGVSVASVTVTATDDDSAGVTVSETTLTLAEAGGTATYTVKLDAKPTGSVTVTPASDDESVATTSGALTFTTTNYATPQAVTVTGVDDDLANASDRTATISHEVADGGYDGVAVASVAVTATDDDSVGVTVSKSAVTMSEAGGTATYTVKLDATPTGSVTVTPLSDDESVATVSGALTFTTTNYATPQTVTVTGIDDDLDNASDRTTAIGHATSGGGYDGVVVAAVAVTATDDDSRGVALSALTLTVPEAGEATYTARLMAKPTGDVLVAPFSANGAVATVSPSFFAGTALTFTPANWNTAQTVTVTGVDDAVVNASPRTATIGHWAVGGGYGALGELAIDDVAVTLADDEEPPTVTLATPSQAVDEGDAATVTLTLSAPLGAAVAVPLSYAHLTSEPDDIEALTEIVMPAGQTSEVRDIRTRQDDDGDNELFVVWIDEAKLPAYLHRGADHRVHVMIVDDDGAPDQVAEVRVVHNGTSLTASWDPPARATVYDVTYYNHRTGENARAAWDRPGTSLAITCDVRPEHVGEFCIDGDSAYTVGVRAGNAAGKSAWVDSARVEPPASATAWLFPSAADPSRRGVVRVSNRSDAAGEVSVTATDDAGWTRAPLLLKVGAGATVEFDSRDLESGGAGLSGATGPGTGDWRLVIDGGALDIEALPYVRVAGGFAAPMNATAPRDGSGALRVALFNPGDEQDARSLLRLVNPGSAEAWALVSGVDDAGRSPGEPVLLTLPAGAACTVDAAELETGTGLACGARQPGLGDGAGRWRLAVSSDAPLVAMNLLTSPDGRLANLSRISAADANGVWHVPLFPSASSASGRQGLVRVVSHAQGPGAVSILATDDSGAAYPPVTLRLPAGAAVDVDAADLELGSRQEGLSGSTGSGAGAWRLALSGDVAFAALAYARGTDGFLTPMRTAAPGVGGRLAYLAPDAGVLRLANAGTTDALVTVAGTDDLGAPSASAVWVAVPAGTAVELTASALESGEAAAIVSGALGDGAGVWRLDIGSDTETVSAMSLLPGPMGSLTDLSGPAPATKTEHAVSR